MPRMSERQTEERGGPWVSATRAISAYGRAGAEELTQKGGLEWRGTTTVVEVPRDGAPPLLVNCPGSEARYVPAPRVECEKCSGLDGLHATGCVNAPKGMLSFVELVRAVASDDRLAAVVADRMDYLGVDRWEPPGTLMPLVDTPKHSADGYCAACDWLYCRVREVKAEPVARCAGCDVGTRTLNFDGGGCFDYPLNADGGMPENARRSDEEQPLCPSCAKKVAEFIAHLKATYGGRR